MTLLLIGLICFGTFVIGMWGATGSMATSYGVSTTESLDELSKIAEVQTQTETVEEVFASPFSQVPFLSEVYSLTFAGMVAVQKLLSVVDNAFTIIATVGGLIPIPDFILTALKALLSVGFLMGILNLVMGGGRA